MKGPARDLAARNLLGNDNTPLSLGFLTTLPIPLSTAEHPLPQAQGGTLSPTVCSSGQAPEHRVGLAGTQEVIGGPALKRRLAIPCTGLAPHK